MIIVGIDPGTQRAGYAVLELNGTLCLLRDLGVWNLLGPNLTKERPSVGIRLERLHNEATQLFKKWNPAVIGMEKAVSFKNVSSALLLSEARGVLRLAAYQVLSQADLRIEEISPTAVKKCASGLGSASKEGVLRALRLRFANRDSFLENSNMEYDAFDALAVAWTARVLRKIAAGPKKSHREGWAEKLKARGVL